MRAPKSQLYVVLILASAVLPPLVADAAPGILSSATALTLGIGVSFALAALSLNVLIGYTGQISLGHAAFLGIGAFASGQVTARGPHLPLIVGLLAAAIAGGLVALLLGVPALRLRGLYLAMATIAFGFTMENSFFRWEPLTGGTAGLELPRTLIGGLVLNENADYLALALVILVLVVAMDTNITRTKLGRAFRAIRSNEQVANSFGVDVTRYKLIAFVIAGSLAGISGAVFGHLVGFVNSATFDFNFSLLLVVIVVLGGLGSRAGVIAAALGLAIFPRLISFLKEWQFIVGPALLIVTMMVNPQGLAQGFRQTLKRRAARREHAQGLGVGTEETLPKLVFPTAGGLPTRTASPLLTVEGLYVNFGGLEALKGVNLEVKRGQVVGLMGPNGAGKTTMFDAITGFATPSAGTVRFLGHDVTHLPPHARVGLGMGRSFQSIGLARDRSVLENLLLSQQLSASYSVLESLLHTRKVANEENELRSQSLEAIEVLGFKKFTHEPVRTLSHGQQRILELTCALFTGSELVLWDEPSAGMAPGVVEQLAVRLRELKETHSATVLLIEHNIPLTLEVCDYIYLLNLGEVLVRGTPAEISTDRRAVAAYFGEVVEELDLS